MNEDLCHGCNVRPATDLCGCCAVCASTYVVFAVRTVEEVAEVTPQIIDLFEALKASLEKKP